MISGSGISQERLGRIIEDAASEVYVFSATDFRFRLVNKGARENLGYSIDEIRELTPWDLKPLIPQPNFIQMIRPLQEGQVDRLDFETIHRRKDGSHYNVLVKLQLFREADDPVFFAAIQDITEHRGIERRLRDTATRLDSILANTTMAVFLMDDRQHCVFMNKAAEELTGFTLLETTGRPLHDVIHHSYPDGSPFPLSECAIDRALPEQAQTQGEEVFVHKDGHFYPVAFTASPLYGDDESAVGTVIEVRDITNDKRNEEARKLLMHEVEHRSRNILAMVQSLTRLTRAPDLGSYKDALIGRLGALARAQASLANRQWEGGLLGDVVTTELAALCPKTRLDLDGPEVWLTAEQVQPISMLLHELATNANKYGALSSSDGRVAVTWSREGHRLKLQWREGGGPSPVAPTREGFGSTLQASLMRQLNGSISRSWEPSGLSVEVEMPC